MGDKVGENPAALRAAVFLLSAKNRRGGGVQTPPPAGRRLTNLFSEQYLVFLPYQLPHYQQAHPAKQSLLLDGLVEATPCEGVL